jgi:hypothetical protein
MNSRRSGVPSHKGAIKKAAARYSSEVLIHVRLEAY